LGATLELAEPEAAVDDPEALDDDPDEPAVLELTGAPVVDGVLDDAVPQAASARSGRAAMTARMRMKKILRFDCRVPRRGCSTRCRAAR
jgi:hypothetical protein